MSDLQVLTRAEVAAILRCHPKTVSRLRIPSFRNGKGKRARRFWRKADVERYVEQKVNVA